MGAFFWGFGIGFSSALISKFFFKPVFDQVAKSGSESKPNFLWLFVLKLLLVTAGILFGVRIFGDRVILLAMSIGIGLVAGVFFPIGIFSSKD
jgi:hypothetical protein